MKRTLQIIFLVSLMMVVLTSCVQKDVPSVTVSGEAKIEVMPDKAEVSISIKTDGTTAAEAQQRNAQKAAQVRNALMQLGFNNKDSETTTYYLDVKREWRNNQYVEVGYQQIHTLKVTLTDLDKVGSVIDAVVSAGANSIDGVAFGLQDATKDGIFAELLTKAVGEARGKAERMTRAAGVNIKRVRTLSESGDYVPMMYASAMKTMSADMAESVPTEINPRKLEIRKTVNVVYDIG